MSAMSVNGQLVPSDPGLTITDQYQGHFLKISFSQEISGQAVFSNDRVDVEPNGDFRFFVPPGNLVVNELVTIEAFSPSGAMIGRQTYSYGSLNAADINIAADDTSSPIELKINPHIVEFNALSPSVSAFKKISGRVIDTSGEKKNAGLQIVIFTHHDSQQNFDISAFKAVATAISDKDGYFYAQAKNDTVAQAFGLIAGLESSPITIPIEDDTLPSNIILVADLSVLDESASCGCDSAVPGLPDSSDLVNSSSFSQDLGGTCVDFTVPNRTLEEFSYYQTVRTTEPEIRGFTINSNDSKRIKNQLFQVSESAFAVLSRLKTSFGSLSVMPFTIEQDDIHEADLKHPSTNPEEMKSVDKVYTNLNVGNTYQAEKPFTSNYVLKLDIGFREQFSLRTSELIEAKPGFHYSDVIQLILAQRRRQARLKELHLKLAAAYCGKNGVQEEKSFCEQFAAEAGIDRAELQSILGHVEKSAGYVKFDNTTQASYKGAVAEIEMIIGSQRIDSKTVKNAAKKTGRNHC